MPKTTLADQRHKVMTERMDNLETQVADLTRSASRAEEMLGGILISLMDISRQRENQNDTAKETTNPQTEESGE